MRDVDVHIEQPCPTYEACLTIRRRTAKPFILDELMDSLPMVARGHAEGAMDAINLKISKVGGLTRAREIRDFCVAMGIAMTIEDSWGGDIVTAAIAHLAQSTPPDLLFSATDFNSYVTLSIAEGAPRRQAAAHGADGTRTRDQPAPGAARQAGRERLTGRLRCPRRSDAQPGSAAGRSTGAEPRRSPHSAPHGPWHGTATEKRILRAKAFDVGQCVIPIDRQDT